MHKIIFFLVFTLLLFSCTFSNTPSEEEGISDGFHRNGNEFIEQCESSYKILAATLNKNLERKSDIQLSPKLEDFVKEHIGSVNSMIDKLLGKQSFSVQIVPDLNDFIAKFYPDYPYEFETSMVVIGRNLLIEHSDESPFLHLYSKEAREEWEVDQGDIDDISSREKDYGECAIAHKWWNLRDIKKIGVDEISHRLCRTSYRNPYRYHFSADELFSRKRIYDPAKRATVFQEYCLVKRGIETSEFNVDEERYRLATLLEHMKNPKY